MTDKGRPSATATWQIKPAQRGADLPYLYTPSTSYLHSQLIQFAAGASASLPLLVQVLSSIPGPLPQISNGAKPDCSSSGHKRRRRARLHIRIASRWRLGPLEHTQPVLLRKMLPCNRARPPGAPPPPSKSDSTLGSWGGK